MKNGQALRHTPHYVAGYFLQSLTQKKITMLKTGIDRVKEANKKHPNRHKEIHQDCCKNCPSEHSRISGIKDPETEEFKQLPKEVIAKEYLFVCAWRESKLCKGLCDEFGIDENFINTLE